MRSMLAVALLLAAGWCSGPGPQPTPPPPTPEPDPSPICPQDMSSYCGCWHRPPGEDWQQLPPCPEPTPEPTPPPLTCANVDCAQGYHCEDTASGPKCVADPLPPATACSIDGEPGPLIVGYRNVLGDQVNEAMHTLRPDCDPGSHCVLVQGRQAWQARVIAELRRRGLCAGQHESTTNEIAVATSPIAPREGWHVYSGEWDGPGTVVWSPGASRPAYAAPDGQPKPPPTGACPSPQPDRSPAHLTIALHRGGQRYDATPQTVSTLDYCTQIGMSPMANGTLRAACPMRSECPGYQCEARQACELYALGGDYRWESRPGGIVKRNPDNPAQATCPGCERIRVCSVDESVCSEWVVPQLQLAEVSR